MFFNSEFFPVVLTPADPWYHAWFPRYRHLTLFGDSRSWMNDIIYQKFDIFLIVQKCLCHKLHTLPVNKCPLSWNPKQYISRYISFQPVPIWQPEKEKLVLKLYWFLLTKSYAQQQTEVKEFSNKTWVHSKNGLSFPAFVLFHSFIVYVYLHIYEGATTSSF